MNILDIRLGPSSRDGRHNLTAELKHHLYDSVRKQLSHLNNKLVITNIEEGAHEKLTVENSETDLEYVQIDLFFNTNTMKNGVNVSSRSFLAEKKQLNKSESLEMNDVFEIIRIETIKFLMNYNHMECY